MLTQKEGREETRKEGRKEGREGEREGGKEGGSKEGGTWLYKPVPLHEVSLKNATELRKKWLLLYNKLVHAALVKTSQ